jgi:hypothetical protein
MGRGFRVSNTRKFKVLRDFEVIVDLHPLFRNFGNELVYSFRRNEDVELDIDIEWVSENLFDGNIKLFK